VAEKNEGVGEGRRKITPEQIEKAKQPPGGKNEPRQPDERDKK